MDQSAAGERVADIFFSYSRKDKERVGLVLGSGDAFRV
jgi:hypothetical protein